MYEYRLEDLKYILFPRSLIGGTNEMLIPLDEYLKKHEDVLVHPILSLVRGKLTSLR
jgi:hypothetical protein